MPQLILNLILVAAIIYVFSRKFRKDPHRVYFWPGYFLKLAAGLALGWYYSHINPAGDAFYYVEDAYTLGQWALQHPLAFVKGFWQPLSTETQELLIFKGQPRAIFMAWIISPIALITQGNFWLVNVYLSTLAFVGIWSLAHKIANSFPQIHQAVYFSFLGYPSFVIWSSGVTKEAVFMGLCALLLTYCWPYLGSFRWKWSLWVFLIVVWVMLRLKYYNTAIILPLLGSSLLFYRLRPQSPRPGLWIAAIFFLLLPLVSLAHPNLDLSQIIDTIRNNSELMAAHSSPEALIAYKEHPTALGWLLVNLPKALAVALFGPFLGDFGSIFQNLVVLEHVLLLLVAVTTLWSRPGISWSSPWFLPILILVIGLGVSLALSAPNFGTLMRYKSVYLPFWVLLLLAANPWWKRLIARLP